jgi:hypothetical protein
MGHIVLLPTLRTMDLDNPPVKEPDMASEAELFIDVRLQKNV